MRYWDDRVEMMAEAYQTYTPERRRLDLAIRRMKERDVHSVLDVGCGPGACFPALKDEGFSVVGCDSSEGMLQEAARRTGVTVFRCDIEKDDLRETVTPVDAVLALSVLPYVDEGKFMGNVLPVVKPGGVLIASMPNVLFDVFTMNTFTADFIIHELVHPAVALDRSADMLDTMQSILDTTPSYPRDSAYAADIPFSRSNPLTIREDWAKYGLAVEAIDFMHFHVVPPRFREEGDVVIEEARERDLEAHRWSDLFTASTFLATCRRIDVEPGAR